MDDKIISLSDRRIDRSVQTVLDVKIPETIEMFLNELERDIHSANLLCSIGIYAEKHGVENLIEFLEREIDRAKLCI